MPFCVFLAMFSAVFNFGQAWSTRLLLHSYEECQVMVLGAGRGPLVEAALKAAERAEASQTDGQDKLGIKL